MNVFFFIRTWGSISYLGALLIDNVVFDREVLVYIHQQRFPVCAHLNVL